MVQCQDIINDFILAVPKMTTAMYKDFA